MKTNVTPGETPRRPSRKKTLSFIFVDDVPAQPEDLLEPIIDPNQVTLEEAIEEVTTEIEAAAEAISEVVETIEDIFPTDEIVEEEDELKMDDDTFEL